MQENHPIKSDALFSRDRRYRYRLIRHVGGARGGAVTFLMLNPSQADEHHDDPTIRRCIGFARRWGYGRLLVVNLFAYCATRPEELFAAPRPVGWGNDGHILAAARDSDCVVCAWGAAPKAGPRAARVWAKLTRDHSQAHVKCLGVTRSGQPRHPLYVRRSAPLLPFRPGSDPACASVPDKGAGLPVSATAG